MNKKVLNGKVYTCVYRSNINKAKRYSKVKSFVKKTSRNLGFEVTDIFRKLSSCVSPADINENKNIVIEQENVQSIYQ